MCETRKFIMAILHGKQGLLSDKNMLFYYHTENLVCSQNNGGCSHFCFPTTTGRSCGCETDISLLNDGRTCENGMGIDNFIMIGTISVIPWFH